MSHGPKKYSVTPWTTSNTRILTRRNLSLSAYSNFLLSLSHMLLLWKYGNFSPIQTCPTKFSSTGVTTPLQTHGSSASRSSPRGNTFGWILCCYVVNSPVNLCSCHIPGKTNIIPNRISCTHVSKYDPNFSLLLQDIPQLRSCWCYCLNPALVSAISLALCSRLSPNPTKDIPKGHFHPVPGGFWGSWTNTRLQIFPWKHSCWSRKITSSLCTQYHSYT